MKKIILLLSAIVLFSSVKLQSQITIGNTQVDTVTVASGLSTPWEILWSPVDSSIWFTERTGKVKKVYLNTNTVKTVLDYENIVEQFGESGMLGMDIIFTTAIAKVFLVYTYKTANNDFYERLVKFDYDEVQDTLVGEIILQDSIKAAVNHDGSRVKIIGNHVYMSTGDAMDLSTPQNIQSLSGKILRYDLNGAIPNDNPIPGSPVYSWGHRNAQGLWYDNNILYSSEHGPSNDDEINIIEKGRNYGWPNVEGYCNTASEITFCNDSNVVEPIYNWTPTIATSDLIYYDHPAIPEFQGSLLMTTLKNQRIYQLMLNASKDSITASNEFFNNYWGRLRDICTNSNGEIFVATNSGNNRIVKIFNPSFTGISTPILIDKIRIHPNPSSTEIQIDLGQNKSTITISIYDSKGKLVMTKKTNQTSISIDHQHLSAGIYIVEISSEDLKTTQKIVLQ